MIPTSYGSTTLPPHWANLLRLYDPDYVFYTPEVPREIKEHIRGITCPYSIEELRKDHIDENNVLQKPGIIPLHDFVSSLRPEILFELALNNKLLEIAELSDTLSKYEDILHAYMGSYNFSDEIIDILTKIDSDVLVKVKIDKYLQGLLLVNAFTMPHDIYIALSYDDTGQKQLLKRSILTPLIFTDFPGITLPILYSNRYLYPTKHEIIESISKMKILEKKLHTAFQEYTKTCIIIIDRKITPEAYAMLRHCYTTLPGGKIFYLLHEDDIGEILPLLEHLAKHDIINKIIITSLTGYNQEELKNLLEKIKSSINKQITINIDIEGDVLKYIIGHSIPYTIFYKNTLKENLTNHTIEVKVFTERDLENRYSREIIPYMLLELKCSRRPILPEEIVSVFTPTRELVPKTRISLRSMGSIMSLESLSQIPSEFSPIELWLVIHFLSDKEVIERYIKTMENTFKHVKLEITKRHDEIEKLFEILGSTKTLIRIPSISNMMFLFLVCSPFIIRELKKGFDEQTFRRVLYKCLLEVLNLKTYIKKQSFKQLMEELKRLGIIHSSLSIKCPYCNGEINVMLNEVYRGYALCPICKRYINLNHTEFKHIFTLNPFYEVLVERGNVPPLLLAIPFHIWALYLNLPFFSCYDVNIDNVNIDFLFISPIFKVIGEAKTHGKDLSLRDLEVLENIATKVDADAITLMILDGILSKEKKEKIEKSKYTYIVFYGKDFTSTPV